MSMSSASGPACRRRSTARRRIWAKIEKKLGNADFVAKAAPEVVEEQREKLAELKAVLAKLAGALDRLKSL